LAFKFHYDTIIIQHGVGIVKCERRNLMSILTVEHLTKDYGGNKDVFDMSFEISI
jgi:hypothetical protein